MLFILQRFITVSYVFPENGERFQCPSCDGNYSQEDNLNAHIKKSHNNAVQKLSYEWFCMNNRLKILRTYPDDVIPSINALNRELNNRWKHLRYVI